MYRYFVFYSYKSIFAIHFETCEVVLDSAIKDLNDITNLERLIAKEIHYKNVTIINYRLFEREAK